MTPRHPVRATLLALALIAGILPAAAAEPAPARAATPLITIEASANPVPRGTTVTITVRTFDQATGAPQGSVGVEVWPYGAFRIFDGSTDISGVATFDYVVEFGTDGLQARRRDINGTTDWLWISGTGPSITTLTLETDPVVEGKPVTFGVSAWNVGANQAGNNGTFTLREQGDPAALGQVTVDGSPGTITLRSGLTAGIHRLVADFGGIGEIVLPSSSDPLEVVVEPDTAVAADPVRIAGTSLYPVKDGYRDTLITCGHLLEPGSATVNVRSLSTGKVVRTLALGHFAEQDTPYCATWNGRRSDGSVVAAAPYRFEHVLTDDFGNSVTRPTARFSVSLKKLAWRTVATTTKQGRLYSYRGGAGWSGWLSTSKSSYAGGLRIHEQVAGYRLTLASVAIPSNAVVKRLTFAVRGRGISGGTAWLAIHNETLGDPDEASAYDSVKKTSSTYTWNRTSTSATGAHLVGRTAYGLVEVYSTYDVDDVRMTLSYAVLR